MRIPTFSINPCIYENTQKITELIEDLDTTDVKKPAKEWLSEAYIRIIEGKTKGEINNKAFAKQYERYEYLMRSQVKEISIINEKEFNEGYLGVTEIVADYLEGNIDEIIDSIDVAYYIKEFIKKRRQIYFQTGDDIWRLLEVSLQEDVRAQILLSELIEEYDMREMVEGVITNTICIEELEVVLC